MLCNPVSDHVEAATKEGSLFISRGISILPFLSVLRDFGVQYLGNHPLSAFRIVWFQYYARTWGLVLTRKGIRGCSAEQVRVENVVDSQCWRKIQSTGNGVNDFLDTERADVFFG